MRLRDRDFGLFKEGDVWKEKISPAHIIIGKRNGDIIPCFLAITERIAGGLVYKKGDFWCNANSMALFDKFIKII
jgi:hypothetical protein